MAGHELTWRAECGYHTPLCHVYSSQARWRGASGCTDLFQKYQDRNIIKSKGTENTMMTKKQNTYENFVVFQDLLNSIWPHSLKYYLTIWFWLTSGVRKALTSVPAVWTGIRVSLVFIKAGFAVDLPAAWHLVGFMRHKKADLTDQLVWWCVHKLAVIPSSQGNIWSHP